MNTCLRIGLVLALPLLAACGDDGDAGEPIGACGLPVSQCQDATGEDAASADAALDLVPDAPDEVADLEEVGEVDATLDTSASDLTASDTPEVTSPDAPPWVVTAAWLAAHLDTPELGLQILDVRAAAAFQASRLPGARRLDPNTLRATVDGVANQAALPAPVAAALSEAGVDADALIVVVGDDTGTAAARVVWVLAYYGAQARLLDGGFPAWQRGGHPLETTAPTAGASDYPLPLPDPAYRVDGAWVLAHLDDPAVHLVDARTSGEYAAGHIPGALSVDWTRNVTGGALRPEAEVRALYAELPPEETIIVYCATGTRASVGWLALRWLGFADVRLYDGSWTEWSVLEGAPVETQ